jgi:hypothetical protein
MRGLDVHAWGTEGRTDYLHLRLQFDADYFASDGLVVIYLSYGRNLLGFFRITRMP